MRFAVAGGVACGVAIVKVVALTCFKLCSHPVRCVEYPTPVALTASLDSDTIVFVC